MSTEETGTGEEEAKEAKASKAKTQTYKKKL